MSYPPVIILKPLRAKSPFESQCLARTGVPAAENA